MDKTQDDNPLHLSVKAARVNQEELAAEVVAKPENSPTNMASNGNGKLEARADVSLGPGLEDTVSFKPGKKRLDASIDASSLPSKPRAKPKTDTVVIPNAGRMLSMRLSKPASGSNDRFADYRQWLGGKSKDELIELLLSHDDPKPENESTDKIAKVRVDEPSNATSEAYQIPADLTYLRLPIMRKTPVHEPTPAWRIVLISLDQSSTPVGLLLDGEITVGRTSGDTSPDLDLTPFGAKNKGISRLHALLRPQMHHLMLIDNDSINGTFWNRLRIPTQTEQPLKEGDVIAFGRANFLVKIVKAPDAREPRTLI